METQEKTIVPDNFNEIMSKLDPQTASKKYFAVRGDLLMYLGVCYSQIMQIRANDERELMQRLDNSFKPDRQIPKYYKKLADAEDGTAWEHNGLIVIISGETINEKRWIHISFSRRSKIPSYEDMVRVKRDFIGHNCRAIMVLPEAKNHVNIHPYCLHLFHCEGDDGLPEFSWGGVSI